MQSRQEPSITRRQSAGSNQRNVLLLPRCQIKRAMNVGKPFARLRLHFWRSMQPLAAAPDRRAANRCWCNVLRASAVQKLPSIGPHSPNNWLLPVGLLSMHGASGRFRVRCVYRLRCVRRAYEPSAPALRILPEKRLGIAQDRDSTSQVPAKFYVSVFVPQLQPAQKQTLRKRKINERDRRDRLCE
jgi:hypothetical protein